MVPSRDGIHMSVGGKNTLKASIRPRTKWPVAYVALFNNNL